MQRHDMYTIIFIAGYFIEKGLEQIFYLICCTIFYEVNRKIFEEAKDAETK